ncbi:MAG: hypothetical protein S4CHLAM7_11830 [Chlamydiae bacterium]|nr:hypothetical protein [Chlamydiota bacterium]
MKSYEEHLKSLLNPSPSSSCNRASAIFPIFFDCNRSMKLLFFNYWKVKRGIDHILCRLYIRDLHGNKILNKCFYVEEVRAYSINLSELIGKRYPFGGSLEIEFASPENLVFPYPAVVVQYIGNHFSTFVHSAQRSYNDEEDFSINQRPLAIESGFNIYADEETDPFITYINGSKEDYKQAVQLAAYNSDQKVIGSSLELDCQPNQTEYISLAYWKELKSHLNGKAGCMKISLPHSKTFPRLLVGNRNHTTGSMSVTHTYYDLTKKVEPSDYWMTPDDSWQPAALMLPLMSPASYITRAYFYPIYSPSQFSIDLEIYNLDGSFIKKAESVLQFTKNASFTWLDLSKYTEGLDASKHYTFKMIATSKASKFIPSRLKVSLDIGLKTGGLPCNICTNFYPANPSLETKKTAFRWAPMMPASLSGSIWCHNDAPKKDYQKTALIKATFYRQRDEKTLQREIKIPPRGTYVIESKDELSHFLDQETGWCTLESDNSFITTYYFTQHSSGMIGGDHGF